MGFLIDMMEREVTIDLGAGDASGGGSFRVRLTPLDVQEFQTLTNSLLDLGFDFNQTETDLAKGMRQIADPKMIEICRKYLPNHIKKLEGIQVRQADGQVRDAELEDLFSSSTSISILMRLLLQLFISSQLSRDDSGN